MQAATGPVLFPTPQGIRRRMRRGGCSCGHCGWKRCSSVTMSKIIPSAFVVAAPVSDRAPAKVRVDFIDRTRGVLFLLMTSSHAVALAGVSEDHFLRSHFWLPRGWAAYCFVILSGFAAAFLFDWRHDRASLTGKMRRRAFQLLVVMFVSNLIMLVLSYLPAGTLGQIREPAWWLGLVTFETHYSLSAVLIPTALMLFTCPLLADVGCRFGTAALAVLALSTAFLVAAFEEYAIRQGIDSVPIRRLFTEGIGGFPIARLWALGSVGFALGTLWKRGPDGVGVGLLVGGAVYVMLCLVLPVPIATRLEGPFFLPLMEISRFLVVLLFVMVTSRSPVAERLLRFNSVIGRFALFSFILHRVVIQGLFIVYDRVLPPLLPAVLYLVLFSGAMAAVYSLCRLRCRSAGLDRRLRGIYL